ncbi:hypothetical protein Tco_0520869 [Tanacetum coccineum]
MSMALGTRGGSFAKHLIDPNVVGAKGSVVSGGGHVFRLVRSSVREKPSSSKGAVGGELGGATCHFENQELAKISDEDARRKDVYL